MVSYTKVGIFYLISIEFGIEIMPIRLAVLFDLLLFFFFGVCVCVFLHNVMVTYIKNEVLRGYGGFGALGHSVYTRELVPRRVEGSWDSKISAIATSGTHTAAITESGLFTCVLFLLHVCKVIFMYMQLQEVS